MAKEEYMAPLDLDNIGGGEEDTGKDVNISIEADNDVELEIVDDTPEEDRGRKPLPKEVTEELEEDNDVEEYSSKVRQRIDQMKKAWHDERRAKEAAMREKDEAIRVAQMAYHERMEYQKRLQEGEMWAIEQAKKRAELELEQAKRSYREAYEAGDSERLVEAQYKLNTATMEFSKVSGYSPQYALQQQPAPVYNQPQQVEPAYEPPKPDSRALEWGEENKWFGKDDEMTSFALGLHQKLIREGVSPQTDEYYERIDARMREVFPQEFGNKPSTSRTGKQRQSSTVVAPVGRAPKGKKVVLTQTQIALAKRLGITPEAYALELVKQQER